MSHWPPEIPGRDVAPGTGVRLASDLLKSLQAQCRRPGLSSWVGKIPGEGNGNPLQYSCLENPMDRRAWWVRVQWVAKSWTRLSNGALRNTHSKLSALLAPDSLGDFDPVISPLWASVSQSASSGCGLEGLRAPCELHHPNPLFTKSLFLPDPCHPL